MANGVIAWIVEHLLKLVELFVVVPIGIAAAFISIVVVVLWQLIAVVLSAVGTDTGTPPDALTTIIRWPYRSLRHIITGDGGFQWTPWT